ncbi:hypothetical protein HDU98_008638 [Podochytrium sp. JEL0797]|nr:hypothetical protein HDU98_008638 [Podochytrium sp. JEL0797]
MAKQLEAQMRSQQLQHQEELSHVQKQSNQNEAKAKQIEAQLRAQQLQHQEERADVQTESKRWEAKAKDAEALLCKIQAEAVQLRVLLENKDSKLQEMKLQKDKLQRVVDVQSIKIHEMEQNLKLKLQVVELSPIVPVEIPQQVAPGVTTDSDDDGDLFPMPVAIVQPDPINEVRLSILDMFAPSLKPALTKLFESHQMSLSNALTVTPNPLRAPTRAPRHEEIFLLKAIASHHKRLFLPNGLYRSRDFLTTQLPAVSLHMAEFCRNREFGKSFITKGDMLQFLEYGEQLWDVCRVAGFEKDYSRVREMVKGWREKLNG